MNIKLSIAVAAALTATAFSANTLAAEATTTATGKVLQPITITKATDLAFGEFVSGSTGGTVVITTGNSRSKTGDVVLSTVGGSAAGVFNVGGEADATFSITAPDTGTLTHTDTTTTMAVDFVHDLDGSTQDSPTQGTLTAGAATIYLGGTLTVGAAQKPGDYSGSATITVEYN